MAPLVILVLRAVGRNKQGKQEERETQRTGKEEVETTVVSEVLSYISPVFSSCISELQMQAKNCVCFYLD